MVCRFKHCFDFGQINASAQHRKAFDSVRAAVKAGAAASEEETVALIRAPCGCLCNGPRAFFQDFELFLREPFAGVGNMAAKRTMNMLFRDDVAPVVAMYLEFELTGPGRALAIEIALSIHVGMPTCRPVSPSFLVTRVVSSNIEMSSRD